MCLQFVTDLVKRYKVSEQGTHFGVIVFSTTPQLQFSFADKEFYKPKRLRKKIKSLPYLGEGTRTDLALTLANLELFSEQGGDRVDKPDVLIVITDGRTHPVLSQPYPEVLQPLQVYYNLTMSLRPTKENKEFHEEMQLELNKVHVRNVYALLLICLVYPRIAPFL